MSDEGFDKLLTVMLDVKETVDLLVKKVDKLEQKVDKLEQGQKETHQKLDKLEDHIDLLASKQWKSEKDIYTIKKTMGLF
ncbi:hypothetical protein ACFFIX_21905 [Metabacillus herbersteinensis]|uniref:Uncharacterized protein n=1 Tax=Metabacillus herbersteinensis TaxID=283816 RepID=A0ABV6GJY7_9BACI